MHPVLVLWIKFDKVGPHMAPKCFRYTIMPLFNWVKSGDSQISPAQAIKKQKLFLTG